LSLTYDITSRDWDNTDVEVNIDDGGFNGIKDLDGISNDFFVEMNGVSNYIDLGENIEIFPSGSSWAFFAWVKLEHFTDIRHLTGVKSQYGSEWGVFSHFGIEGNKITWWDSTDGWRYNNTPLQRYNWHHIGLSHNGAGTITFWLDGVKDGVSSVVANLSNMVIAEFCRRGHGADRYFYGSIDDISLWGFEPTESYVQNIIMDKDDKSTELNISSYYSFNSPHSNAIIDMVSGRNGVLTSGTWKVYDSNSTFNNGNLSNLTSIDDKLHLNSFYDDFSNGLINFENITGVWSVNTDNQAYNSSSGGTVGDYLAIKNKNSTNAYIETELVVGATNGTRALFGRLQDDGTNDPNYYMLHIDDTNNQLDLYKRVNGSWTQLRSVSAFWDIGETIKVSLEIHDNILIGRDLTNNIYNKFADKSIAASGKWGIGDRGTTTNNALFNYVKFLESKSGYRVNQYDVAHLDKVTNSTLSWQGVNKKNIIPNMSSNTLPSNAGRLFGGGVYNTTDYDYYNAVSGTNNSSTDCWITVDNTPSGWIAYEFQEKKSVVGYRIQNRNNNHVSTIDGSPKEFTLQGSNNNINWDILDTRTNEVDWDIKEGRTYYLSEPANYKIYKLDITANNGVDWTGIGKWELFSEYENDNNYIESRISSDGGVNWSNYKRNKNGKYINGLDGEYKELISNLLSDGSHNNTEIIDNKLVIKNDYSSAPYWHSSNANANNHDTHGIAYNPNNNTILRTSNTSNHELAIFDADTMNYVAHPNVSWAGGWITGLTYDKYEDVYWFVDWQVSPKRIRKCNPTTFDQISSYVIPNPPNADGTIGLSIDNQGRLYGNFRGDYIGRWNKEDGSGFEYLNVSSIIGNTLGGQGIEWTPNGILVGSSDGYGATLTGYVFSIDWETQSENWRLNVTGNNDISGITFREEDNGIFISGRDTTAIQKYYPTKSSTTGSAVYSLDTSNIENIKSSHIEYNAKSGLYFDGDNDYFDFDMPSAPNGVITIDVEFKALDTARHQCLISQRADRNGSPTHSRGITLNDNNLNIWSRNSAGTWQEITHAFNSHNKYHKVRLVQENNMLYYYLDGVKIGESNMGSNLTDYLSYFRVGNYTDSSYYYKGNINKINIWGTNKGTEHIDMETNGSEVGLVWSSDFQNPSTTSIIDIVNGNNGTSYGVQKSFYNFYTSVDSGASWVAQPNKSSILNITDTTSEVLAKIEFELNDTRLNPYLDYLYIEVEDNSNIDTDNMLIEIKQNFNAPMEYRDIYLSEYSLSIGAIMFYKWSLDTTTPSTWNEYQQIKDLDNDNASFSEGTLTDVVAVDDGLELENRYVTEFTGSNNITIPDDASLDITNEITLQVTMNIDKLPSAMASSYPCLIGKSNETYNFICYSGGADNIGLRMNYKTADQLQTEYTLTNTGILTITATYDGSEIVLYEDGEVKVSKSGSVPIHTDGSDINIGGGWEGVVLDAQIWNIALTQTEIQNNLYEELSGSETGLVSYWKIDEGTGTTIYDSAGSNNGTINTANWKLSSEFYKYTGTRQSPQLDLSAVGNVESGTISWVETLNSQTITIETSVDGGSTWQTATNGGAIPNLPSDPTTLDVRQVLSTTDTTVTPVLESLEVQVDEKIFQTQEGQWYLHTEYFENNEKIQEYNGPYNIDKTPPAVPNVNLINNTSHSFSLNWTNQDDLSGVDYVELYAEESDGSLNYVADIDIDGDSNTEPSIQLSSTDTDYTVDGLSEYTNYRYKVRVFDKVGNFSEDTYAEMITDDITEPIVGYSLNSRDWLNTDVDEVINVVDQAGSGVAEAWYKWTNSAVQPTDGWIVMGTTTNFATSQSQEGEWYLHIKATDNYNNTAYDYSGPYKIDKTAPVISSTNITIDSPTGVYDTYTATIEWFIEDQQDLSGVDRTEVGFYVDGIWHYNENTLPDGITTNTDMDNITGGGSKTAIFSNVPREIDIAASFNGYDIATNETGEQQISSIFTPRIYATHTLSGKTDYEMGINSEYKSETKYETGINKNYQSPSSQIIDVLSKTYNSPASYEMGKRAKYKSQTLYEAGINKKEGPAPSLQDILVFYDEPILVSGKFAQGIRLGLSDLEVDISDFNEWTMHVFRRGIDDSEFRTIFINSNGEVYVDNKINNEYDVSWFESTNEKITIKSGAIDIDELLVFPQIIDQKQIDRIGGFPFYDPNENIKVDMPDSVDMEVMQ
jgi:hypothetical protein